MQVAFAAQGSRAWTNGSIIYVVEAADSSMQLMQLCLLSALLAGDSLDREILKKLVRKPALTQRYFAIEGARALKNINDLLPPSLATLNAFGAVPLSESASHSLAIARSPLPISECVDAFGTILPKALLLAQAVGAGNTAAGNHNPRKHNETPLRELVDDAGEDNDSGNDIFTSPVGGGGGIGKWLQKMLQQVRQLKGGGSPGADAPTHWSRAGVRSRISVVRSAAAVDTITDAFGKNQSILYPEWDIHRQCYRPDWCAVQEIEPQQDAELAIKSLQNYGLRKSLSRLGVALDRFHRQNQGDDIDIDAAIEAQIELAAGTFPDEAIYVESQRHKRDLSVLVLLDISGSVAQPSVGGNSVHEQQRDVAAALMSVLHGLGDRVALYAFHSQGRSAVHLTPVKHFDEALDSRVVNRLFSLKPGAYSRLGAAIRHGATVVLERGGTSRKLLVVLSDGLAYDHGYEPAYAAADVRKALGEARRDGVGCLCLSIGADTSADTLRRVFGSSSHALISHPDLLAYAIGPLFRSALQTAEMQRRIA